MQTSAVLQAAPHTFRPQLLDRRARLKAASHSVSPDYLNSLLHEIDAALERMEAGTYGLCETCHDAIEPERIEQNPLTRFCLDHLSREELASHQQDLDLATQIQAKLLPPREMALDSWDTHYRYVPVGAVGGDYCELIVLDEGNTIFFAVGDVSGKGIAASLLMTHLSAMFRSLLSLDLSLAEVVSRVNRLFCESTGPSHYATLVCGRATAHGVEMCNAGHCPPLVLRHKSTERLDSTGLPLGLFCGCEYTVHQCSLGAGEALVLYSDGITEAQDPSGDDYREERLIRSSRERLCQDASAMAESILQDVGQFRKSGPAADDVTLLIVRRRA